jgi:head-tail adaptor
MFIGNFNRSIVIENPVKVKNSYGEESIEWAVLDVVYAEKFQRSIRNEKFEANQKVAVQYTVYTIYYMDGITTESRIIDEDTGEIFEIEGIKEINYQEGLQLYCYSKDRF